MITFFLIPDLEVFQLFSIAENGISQYKLKVVVLETFFFYDGQYCSFPLGVQVTSCHKFLFS